MKRKRFRQKVFIMCKLFTHACESSSCVSCSLMPVLHTCQSFHCHPCLASEFCQSTYGVLLIEVCTSRVLSLDTDLGILPGDSNLGVWSTDTECTVLSVETSMVSFCQTTLALVFCELMLPSASRPLVL